MSEYKAKEVIEILKQRGYEEKSIRGDHHKYSDKFGHVVIVPYTTRNSAIAVGTYKAIIRQLNQDD